MFGRSATGLFNLGRLRGEVDRFYSEFFESPGRSDGDRNGHWGREAPALNVWEDDSSFYAEAELPGLTLNDVEIFVVKNELTVKGERKEEARDDVTYHRRERELGPFTRVLHLPADIEADKVHATLREGVLTITLPKAETAKPRKIPVVAR
jgi:HSP20 family protein